MREQTTGMQSLFSQLIGAVAPGITAGSFNEANALDYLVGSAQLHTHLATDSSNVTSAVAGVATKLAVHGHDSAAASLRQHAARLASLCGEQRGAEYLELLIELSGRPAAVAAAASTTGDGRILPGAPTLQLPAPASVVPTAVTDPAGTDVGLDDWRAEWYAHDDDDEANDICDDSTSLDGSTPSMKSPNVVAAGTTDAQWWLPDFEPSLRLPSDRPIAAPSAPSRVFTPGWIESEYSALPRSCLTVGGGDGGDVLRSASPERPFAVQVAPEGTFVTCVLLALQGETSELIGPDGDGAVTATPLGRLAASLRPHPSSTGTATSGRSEQATMASFLAALATRLDQSAAAVAASVQLLRLALAGVDSSSSGAPFAMPGCSPRALGPLLCQLVGTANDLVSLKADADAILSTGATDIGAALTDAATDVLLAAAHQTEARLGFPPGGMACAATATVSEGLPPLPPLLLFGRSTVQLAQEARAVVSDVRGAAARVLSLHRQWMTTRPLRAEGSALTTPYSSPSAMRPSFYGSSGGDTTASTSTSAAWAVACLAPEPQPPVPTAAQGRRVSLLSLLSWLRGYAPLLRTYRGLLRDVASSAPLPQWSDVAVALRQQQSTGASSSSSINSRSCSDGVSPMRGLQWEVALRQRTAAVAADAAVASADDHSLEGSPYASESDDAAEGAFMFLHGEAAVNVPAGQPEGRSNAALIYSSGSSLDASMVEGSNARTSLIAGFAFSLAALSHARRYYAARTINAVAFALGQVSARTGGSAVRSGGEATSSHHGVHACADNISWPVLSSSAYPAIFPATLEPPLPRPLRHSLYSAHHAEASHCCGRAGRAPLPLLPTGRRLAVPCRSQLTHSSGRPL